MLREELLRLGRIEEAEIVTTKISNAYHADRNEINLFTDSSQSVAQEFNNSSLEENIISSEPQEDVIDPNDLLEDLTAETSNTHTEETLEPTNSGASNQDSQPEDEITTIVINTPETQTDNVLSVTPIIEDPVLAINETLAIEAADEIAPDNFEFSDDLISLACQWSLSEQINETFLINIQDNNVYWVEEEDILEIREINSGLVRFTGIKSSIEVDENLEEDVELLFKVNRINGSFSVESDVLSSEVEGSCSLGNLF